MLGLWFVGDLKACFEYPADTSEIFMMSKLISAAHTVLLPPTEHTAVHAFTSAWTSQDAQTSSHDPR